MRPLLIGEAERADLRRLKHHAERHPFTLDVILAAAEGGVPYAREPEFRCFLPVGFGVCFTIERHPSGWARHLSVSVNGPGSEGRVPSSHALQMIGRELGMRMSLFDAETESYFEGPEGAPPVAVNIIEPVLVAEAPAPVESRRE
jgi:hypothetical protein